ncbi:hypothetical protein Y032_0021g338 [Ancylostoma ceylanicum]|uniref:C2H2-type domain-containing protein n=1 Tax=Ancylostoma ceylanicum TaxID=53326 RepID=A0A016V0W6_9BILA|nr:hypothetical protein Y032_0021g338 [Ancylostoma ceylanicum]
MQQSKFVVVEVTTTTSTMTLIQYLITNGFDKFAVVSDLSDHPSLKYKVTSHAGSSTPNQQQNNGVERQSGPAAASAATDRNGKPKVSINEIASALSRKSSPSQLKNGFCGALSPQSVLKAQLNGGSNCKTVSALSRILEDQSRANILEQKQEQERREQERQQQEIQRIILAQAAASCQPMVESFTGALEHDESNGSPELDDAGILDSSSVNASGGELNGGMDLDAGADSSDGGSGLGPSDEQVRASMIHLLNPVLGSAFGSSLIEEVSSGKRKGEEGGSSGASKKHRWMTVDELEESRFGRSKSYGRVHCKATYKCALCGKPTTLNSTGSRWNLLRHVIMIHSDSKPYQCWDCDFIGIKSNVISHARQTNHRSDDAHDITTDVMRSEWNTMLHQCFPDYVKAKSRGWQASHDDVAAIESPEIKSEDAVVHAIESPEIKSEE